MSHKRSSALERGSVTSQQPIMPRSARGRSSLQKRSSTLDQDSDGTRSPKSPGDKRRSVNLEPLHENDRRRSGAKDKGWEGGFRSGNWRSLNPPAKVSDFSVDPNHPDLGVESPKESHSGTLNKALSTSANDLGGNRFMGEELLSQPIFQTCSAEFFNSICGALHSKSYMTGQVIVEAARPGHCMMLVMRGSLNMFVRDMKVETFNKGDYLGETILLGIDDHWQVTLKAETPCTVYEITREGFARTLAKNQSEKRFYDKLKVDHNQCELTWAGTLECTVHLFKGLSESVLRSIDKVLIRRLYFPDQKLLVEGAVGDNLLMLVRGTVAIMIAERVVRVESRYQPDSPTMTQAKSPALIDEGVLPLPALEKGDAEQASLEFLSAPISTAFQQSQKRFSMESAACSTAKKANEEPTVPAPPIVFGELGLLGMQQVRCATVLAQSVCQVRVLYRSVLMKCLEESGESLVSMNDYMQKRYQIGDPKGDSQKENFLKEVPIFKQVGCTEEFLDFLGHHLEDRMYLPGMRIIDEALPDDKCMYIITSGAAEVCKGGHQVATLGTGAVVGELTVLGIASKRSSSVIATETCHMKGLHQSVVVKALEMFPDEREKVMLMVYEKTRAKDDDVTSDEATNRVAKKKSQRKAFMKVLKNSPLFSTARPQFVEELSKEAIDRIYMPGDCIIEQGASGDSMFIMVSGMAGVYVANPELMPTEEEEEQRKASKSSVGVQTATMSATKASTEDIKRMPRVGTLNAGSVTGELAMLGVSTLRSATIVAETICSMWEITQEKAIACLERFPDAQQNFSTVIVKHLERTVPNRLLSMELLKGFDRKFRTLLGLYCDRLVYFPGAVIVREGQVGQGMVIVNCGRASLEKKGVSIKTFSPGNHFGSTVMLGVHKVYLGTLISIQTCHVLRVSRNSYIDTLKQYPSPHAAARLKHSEKKNAEELKEAMRWTSARLCIWKRYQGMLNPETQDATEKVLTESELLHKVFELWHKAAEDQAHRRKANEKERVQYRQMMERWAEKKREALKQTQKRYDEEQRRLDAVCPHRQRCQQNNSSWEPKHRGRKAMEGQLPPVAPNFCSATPDSAQLVTLLKEWPTPRPSPFYDLKVWNVLADSLENPGSPAPLLALLTGPPNTAVTELPASSEPFGASPPGTAVSCGEGVLEGTEALDAKAEQAALLEDSSDSDFGDDTVEQMLANCYSEEVTMDITRSSFSASDPAAVVTRFVKSAPTQGCNNLKHLLGDLSVGVDSDEESRCTSISAMLARPPPNKHSSVASVRSHFSKGGSLLSQGAGGAKFR